MAVDIVMPQMGESIFEGTITKWLKKPGDKVERDEPLFEISTDKVDAEIPSPSAGVLKEIKVNEGQTVPIQTVVAVIDGAGAAAAVPAPAKTAAPAAPPQPAAVAPPPPPTARPSAPSPVIAMPAPAAAAPQGAAREDVLRKLPDRADERHAPAHRRAHDRFEARFAARVFGGRSGHDQGGLAARQSQGGIRKALRNEADVHAVFRKS